MTNSLKRTVIGPLADTTHVQSTEVAYSSGPSPMAIADVDNVSEIVTGLRLPPHAEVGSVATLVGAMMEHPAVGHEAQLHAQGTPDTV